MSDTRQMLVRTARQAEGLLVWTGKFGAAMASAFSWILDPLYEASAEVGSWVVSKSSAQVQARVRSRFL